MIIEIIYYKIYEWFAMIKSEHVKHTNMKKKNEEKNV